MNWFSTAAQPAPVPAIDTSSSFFSSFTGGGSSDGGGVLDGGSGSSLSYKQRITMFVVLFALAGLFFFLASLR
jgi:hypothetical protein